MRTFRWTIALFLVACSSTEPRKDSHSVAADQPRDLPEDSGDAGAPEDSGEPVPPDDDTGTAPDDAPEATSEWTTGPALPECTPRSSDTPLIALSGVVLMPDGPVAGEVVYDQSTGLIVCAGDDDCAFTDVTRICTEGVISPGLIDAHNHMQYNVLVPWEHDELFSDRYDWRSDGDYWDYRTAYDDVKDTYKCEIMKWAELRSLVGGTTAVVGSSGGACINPLARNLDEGEGASGIADYELYYSASTVTDRFDAGSTVNPGTRYDAVENHVGEGIGGSVTAEIAHMMNIGMEGPGHIYVHATDATTQQLARMADEGTAIAWSPRSNLDLYAATTPADVAHRIGVPIALSPDWTWSGSMSPARELTCAKEWLDTRDSTISDHTLWSWVTADAARILNLDGVLGALLVGMKADIAVFDWSDQPYRPIVEADPRAVRLVTVNGNALVGRPDLVVQLTTEPEWCEAIPACEGETMVCAQAGWSGDDAQRAADLETTLTSALGAVSMPAGFEYANALLGLFSCGESRESCNIAEPGPGDTDGDGIADEDDDCPNAHNPLQRDEDQDGVGDACDPCPLAADQPECTHAPGDVDGDGIASDDDGCPYAYDPDQGDRDGDGHGDACDLCPDEPNPGEEACGYAIGDLRDPSSPRHPAEGTSVRISDVAVTGVYRGRGFYVQDPDAASLGGLYVYGDGAITDDDGVAVGDRVRVTGVYSEYYGLSQIGSPTVAVIGSLPVPDTIDVADACAIGTDGALAELLEGMLVRVTEVTVTSANPDAPSDYGEFEVNGCLRIDDQLSDVLIPQPPEGATYSALSGVLTYTYGNTKLVPRGAEDVAE